MPELCRDSALDSSSVYGTMIRSAGSWATVGPVVEAVMRYYDWRHVAVLSDQQPTLSICSPVAATIINWLSTSDAKANNFTIYSILMNDSPSSTDLDYYLSTIRRCCRGLKNVKTDVESITNTDGLETLYLDPLLPGLHLSPLTR